MATAQSIAGNVFELSTNDTVNGSRFLDAFTALEGSSTRHFNPVTNKEYITDWDDVSEIGAVVYAIVKNEPDTLEDSVRKMYANTSGDGDELCDLETAYQIWIANSSCVEA
jgi:hypothetical protein